MAYLPREEYIDRQNRHDKLLNDELHSIRFSIDHVKTELKEDVSAVKDDVSAVKDDVSAFKDDVSAFKDDVSARFDRLESNLEELRAEQMRTEAYIRNTTLRNPSLTIRPLVAFRPDQGFQYPNPSFFPRHADEFYSLRNPTTNRQRHMLAYLANFYDVPYGPSNEDDVIIENPEVTVDLLESILGLNEDKINKFRQKVLDYTSRPRPPPIKRSQIDPPDNVPHRQKQGLRLIPYSDDATTSSPKSDSTRIEWGKRLTPFSQQAPQIRLNRRGEKISSSEESERGPSDAGTTTNPNTSPRQSH